jgi:predicted HTH domain antitoxin
MKAMSTETITLEVSQDVLAALKMGANDLGEQLRLLAAIAFFQNKQLSLGKAAELAGLNRLAFIDLLAQKGIVAFDYDESALQTDLAGIAELVDNE